MYISEIEITNLRSFRGTQKVSLDRGDGTYAGWTVFAGRNGSGKSTLLKAIAAAAAGPLAVRALVGGPPPWLRDGCSNAAVKAVLTVDPDEDQLSARRLGPAGHGSPLTLRVELDWESESPSSRRTRGMTTFRASERSGDHDLAMAGPWMDWPVGWFIAGYGPYRRLGPKTAEVAKFSSDEKLSSLLNLFSESATLADAVDWLKNLNAAALEKNSEAKALLGDVVKLLNDGLLPDGSKVTRVNSEGMWITREGVTVLHEQVSDGYRTVSALVVDIARRLHARYDDLQLHKEGELLRCPLPGVVLIDEIDAHMHVEWQQKIGFWLTSHFPNLQFLVTSHSPFICQAASPRGIIRLPAPGEDRSIEHIDERLFHSIVNGGADDAVMSQLFGLEHAHSQPAEELRERAAALELKVVTGTASTKEQQEHAEILSMLPGDIGEEADRKLRMVRKAASSAPRKAPTKKPARTKVAKKAASKPTAKKKVATKVAKTARKPR